MSTPSVKPSTAPAPAAAGPARQKNLLALGSAAVLTVYATGFMRTQAAAQVLAEGSDARRRPVASGPDSATLQTTTRAVASPTVPTTDSAQYRVVLAQGVPQVVANAGTDTATWPRTSAAPMALTKSAKTSGAAAATTAAVEPTSIANTPEPLPAPVTPAPATPAPTPTPAAVAAAPAPVAAPAPAPAAEAPKRIGWQDGTYTGWGTSRHGDIEATVVIENGKITGAIISRCLTRYSCSWVAHLQQQVVARQSPEVDNVSGATQSANAFFYAVSEALSKAK
jgi:uncharacterized protein with FMN-binding domain